MTQDDIDSRLAAIEARIPVEANPPEPAPAEAAAAEARRWRRSAIALVAAPVLVLALAATAIAGPGVIRFITVSTGSAAIDTKLANAGLECMTPPQAAAWLAANGYDKVVWDTGGAFGSGLIEAAPDPSALPVIQPGASLPLPSLGTLEGSGAVAADRMSSTATPPADGVVFPGPTIDGTLHMIVDTKPGATRPSSCPAAMP